MLSEECRKKVIQPAKLAFDVGKGYFMVFSAPLPFSVRCSLVEAYSTPFI